MTCRHAPGDPKCTSGNSPTALAEKGRRLVNQWGGGGAALAPGPRNQTYGTSQKDQQREIDRLRQTLLKAQAARATEPATPDADNYQIVDSEQVGSTLCLKVKYPSCAKCSYEGTKVMVFLDTTTSDALKWTRIDPHFRDSKAARQPYEAPSPEARFPASDQGWGDALAYAQRTQGAM